MPAPDVLVIGDANPDLLLTGDAVPRVRSGGDAGRLRRPGARRLRGDRGLRPGPPRRRRPPSRPPSVTTLRRVRPRRADRARRGHPLAADRPGRRDRHQRRAVGRRPGDPDLSRHDRHDGPRGRRRRRCSPSVRHVHSASFFLQPGWHRTCRRCSRGPGPPVPPRRWTPTGTPRERGGASPPLLESSRRTAAQRRRAACPDRPSPTSTPRHSDVLGLGCRVALKNGADRRSAVGDPPKPSPGAGPRRSRRRHDRGRRLVRRRLHQRDAGRAPGRGVPRRGRCRCGSLSTQRGRGHGRPSRPGRGSAADFVAAPPT